MAPTISGTQFHKDGFYVLTDIFTSAELAKMRHLLDLQLAGLASKSLGKRGRGIRALASKIPEFGTYMMRPALLDAIAPMVGGWPELRRIGARVSDDSSSSVLANWHNHYHWDPARLLCRAHIERVLAVVYIDGAGPDRISRLMGLRRCLNDPLGCAPTTTDVIVEIVMDPGNIVVFDSAFWHSAYRGTGSGRRRIVGGHYQSPNTISGHPDDDDPFDLPVLEGPHQAERKIP